MEEVATYPKMLSTFIASLQTILAEKGDMPVAARGPWSYHTAKVSATVEPYYWDGGILLPAVDTPYHVSHWLRSKTHPIYPTYVEIYADNPEPPDDEFPESYGDTIDGVQVPPYQG